MGACFDDFVGDSLGAEDLGVGVFGCVGDEASYFFGFYGLFSFGGLPVEAYLPGHSLLGLLLGVFSLYSGVCGVFLTLLGNSLFRCFCYGKRV